MSRRARPARSDSSAPAWRGCGSRSWADRRRRATTRGNRLVRAFSSNSPVALCPRGPRALACVLPRSRIPHSETRSMSDNATPIEPGPGKALASLQTILVRDETLEAWAIQRRVFALFHRRVMLAATNNRLIALKRGLFGGFEYSDLRWQDLKEAHVSVGIFGATLRLLAEDSSDL